MPESETMKQASDRLLLVADLAGTFMFALEGARRAIAGNLDFLGVMVLAFATALGGGIIRDLLIGVIRRLRCAIGATPPRPFWRAGLCFSSTARSRLFLSL